MGLRPTLLGLVFIFLLGSSQDEESAKTKRSPRHLVLATAEEAAAGLLAWSTDESIALLTDRGERVFRWEDLRPYSVWRVRSILAERDAAKRIQLAEYCREQKLFREARWEFGAARALDPSVAPPDLEELRKLDADSFMPGALGMAPTAVAKQLEKESAEAWAARGVAEQKRQADRKKELGVTDVKTLVWQGDTSRRLDIVFACDGWTEAEQPKYHGIVDQLVKAVVKVDPMANYPSYINFHRVSIVESKSGIGGKTRLGSRVQKGILTCDDKAAWEVASLAPDADLVFVVSNVKDVRSTGGSGVLTLASSGDMNDTAIHELGHAFADLDDEYEDDSVQDRFPAWDPADEPQHINTTQISDPK